MTTPLRVIDDDVVFGRYIAHFVTHRLRLLIQAGVIYGVAAIVINLATFSLEGTLVNIVVPLMYALVAMPLIWYLAHLWNREVILYERGFTYRQGSVVAAFPYENIVRMRVVVENIAYFGVIPRQKITADLESDNGDKMHLNQTLKDARKLVETLERAVVKARKPLIQRQIEQGSPASFGMLTLKENGIETDDGRTLAWNELNGVRVQDMAIQLVSGSEVWGSFPLAEIDAAALLLVVLKERTQTL
jgi:hypothetical protein